MLILLLLLLCYLYIMYILHYYIDIYSSNCHTIHHTTHYTNTMLIPSSYIHTHAYTYTLTLIYTHSHTYTYTLIYTNSLTLTPIIHSHMLLYRRSDGVYPELRDLQHDLLPAGAQGERSVGRGDSADTIWLRYDMYIYVCVFYMYLYGIYTYVYVCMLYV